jgi:lyso-ornithine lipid O-acyltransferase
MLALFLLICFFRYTGLWLVARLRGRAVTPLERAQWMQSSGKLVLTAMGIRWRVEGVLPSGSTLVVANHLSYLDIVIASVAVPCAFVAKKEIADWPVFGPLGAIGGTIFLDRASRASAWATVDVMAERLADQVPVLFFPEGTSTDGRQVTRFHSTLFAPAVESGLPVMPAAIFYEPHAEGVAERDVCWYGDEAFLPHLLQVLALRDFTAVMCFGTPEIYPDRRTAAWRSHDAVECLRAKGSAPSREKRAHAQRASKRLV